MDSSGKPQGLAVILDSPQQVYNLWMVGLHQDILHSSLPYVRLFMAQNNLDLQSKSKPSNSHTAARQKARTSESAGA